MPCRDDQWEYEQRQKLFRDIKPDKFELLYDWFRKKFDVTGKEKAQARCDEMAQMLCWLCGTLEGMDVEIDLTTNPKLFDWWKTHQKNDEERVKSEMRRQKSSFKTSEIMACTFINRALEIHAVSDYHKKWFRKLAEEIFEEES